VSLHISVQVLLGRSVSQAVINVSIERAVSELLLTHHTSDNEKIECENAKHPCKNSGKDSSSRSSINVVHSWQSTLNESAAITVGIDGIQESAAFAFERLTVKTLAVVGDIISICLIVVIMVVGVLAARDTLS